MKFNKVAMCLAITMAGFATTAMAATSDVSSGTVDFTGSIVNTPCAITTANKNLKVDLGQVKMSSFLKKGDTSANQLFNVVLSNCSVNTTTPYTATVTFDGASADGVDKTALLAGAGSDTSGAALATGVGVQILDGTSTALNLKSATTAVSITQSEMTLPFSARYISVADSVTPGLANSHADFTVSYN